MGYSIAIRCKNKELKEKMITFMEANYRGWSKIGNQQDDYSRFSDDLSYDSGKMAIGFDYNACEPDRDYIFAVCRWMALKIGRKRRWKELGLIPFYVCDGGHTADDRFPILVKDEWEKKAPNSYEWCLVTSTGFKPVENKYKGSPLYEEYKKKGRVNEFITKHTSIYENLFGGCKKVNKLISDELKRLDDLWRKQ